MTRLLCILLVSIVALSVSAQVQLNGRIVDAKTGEPLAFVNIVANNEKVGTATDIDGKFSIQSQQPITTIQCSYVGYHPLQYSVKPNESELALTMARQQIELNEVVILPGENPAHRIIKRVVENRKINNPEKACSFKYNTYNKLFLTANLDSAILYNPERYAELDSNDREAVEFLEKHHLFMMESITERKFVPPDNSYEEVKASRVSGFKNPTFSMIATEMQSFTFYKPLISVGGITYLNPISKGSTNKYLFVLEDTSYTAQDTVFVISYRPKKGKNFDGLKGLLYINTNKYALQNVIAEPAEPVEGFSIKVQQKYEHINGQQWFPVQLNTFLFFNLAQVNNFKVMGVGRSYLKDIEINPDDVTKKGMGNVEVKIAGDATRQEDDFWNEHRIDTLDQREQNTYHVIDSLGEAAHFDRLLKTFEALLTGRIPVKFIDLDIDRFLNFNDYEGLRLGAGFHTNDRVSRIVSVGGYGAYGFKDKAFKYGGDINFKLHQPSETALNFSYQSDVVEFGGVSFYDDRPGFLSTEGYRLFYMNRMDEVEKVEARLSFRALEHFKWHLYGNQQQRRVTNDYRFLVPLNENITLLVNDYYITEAGLGIRFGYKEKFVQTLSRKISMGTKYPIVWANIGMGFDHLGDGEYAYTRYDVKLEKTFRLKGWGSPGFRLMAGYIDENLPANLLYNSRASYVESDRTILRISSTNTFETMRVNEFTSSQYMALFFQHSFENLLINTKKFKPEFVVVHNLGFGKLDYPLQHEGIAINTMEKGYFETGLRINNLLNIGLSGIGIAGFYRYGPYAFPDLEDNFAVKVSFSVNP